MIPSFGRELSSDPAAAEASLAETAKVLELHRLSAGVGRASPRRRLASRDDLCYRRTPL